MSAPVHVTSGQLSADELMGRAAMALVTRPRWKFGIVDGDRRRFHERTPRPAIDLKIIKGENQCR